jgi:hypothetical protein
MILLDNFLAAKAKGDMPEGYLRADDVRRRDYAPLPFRRGFFDSHGCIIA